MQINVAHIEPRSDIYGPGTRFVIWVQGCSLRCPGCWNSEMWTTAPNKIYTLENLWAEIEMVRQEIEGITILGGEPLDQIEPIRILIKQARQKGLSVVLFTGYEYEEIVSNNWQEIFLYTDILITGRYVEQLRTLEHQWIGSTNQDIYFLSKRYDKSLLQDANYMELEIGEDGTITLLGFPDDKWREFVSGSL